MKITNVKTLDLCLYSSFSIPSLEKRLKRKDVLNLSVNIDLRLQVPFENMENDIFFSICDSQVYHRSVFLFKDDLK